MSVTASWPIWVVVLLCGVLAQVIKFSLYSVTNRQVAVTVLGQSHGVPSLPAAVLFCLYVLSVLRTGWVTGATGFALVLVVIVVHDTVKLRMMASRQREVLYRLVVALPDAGPFHQWVADYLDPRPHHPAHVVVGGIFGALFALAFGIQPS